MSEIKLRDIIEAGSKKRATAPSDLPLRHAACEMSTHGIGIVVVTDRHDAIIGILSERDVTRAFADHGEDAINATVAEHMSTNPVTCEERKPPTQPSG